MRPLATGGFTDEQLADQLRSGSANYGCRFEILDPNFDVIDQLEPGVVFDAAVEVNVDQAIRGSMDLKMLPAETLRDRLFRRWIKPWFQLDMPDGKIAEWPQGVYVWTVPDRDLPALGQEEWSITLGDQLHVLDLAGPGRPGFTVTSGQRVTDAIRRALKAAGIVDTSGIVESDDIVDEPKTWVFVTPRTTARRQREYYETLLERTTGSSAASVAKRAEYRRQINRLKELAPDADNQRVSWLAILEDLHDSIGYDPPWFDSEGRYRATPADDLATATADHVLETGEDSILLDINTGHELDKVANRVFVKGENAKIVNKLAVADANTLFPNHPLCEKRIGFHRDAYVEDRVATNHAALERRAKRELRDALLVHESADATSLAWPTHDAFDVVGARWDGDHEFNDTTLFHQRRHTLDLFTGVMRRHLERIYQ